MVGIISYGFYVPKYRILIDNIANVWGKNPKDIKSSLMIEEKAVAGIDEDSLTMAYEAAAMALDDRIDKTKIGSIFFGSETPPYAVNPSSTILGEFLGVKKDYLAYDTQFACKAATGAIISTIGLVKSNMIDYGLVCSADKSTGRPHDALEYTAGSGATAFLIGKSNVILEIIDQVSFSSDTPDFWRREGIRYPSHSGRFTGKPSYFYHVQNAAKNLLLKTKLKPENFAHAVFHMPNGKFPRAVATSLGFSQKQIEKSLVVGKLGNSYTSSALMGLVAVLEYAKPNDLIFFVSYGSGAGSDGFVFKVTKNLINHRQKFQSIINNKTQIDYPTYLKFMGII